MKKPAKGMNAKDFNRAIMTLYDGVDNIEYFTPTREISEKGYDAAWDHINAHEEGDIVLNVPEFQEFIHKTLKDVKEQFKDSKYVESIMLQVFSARVLCELRRRGERR